MRFLKVILILTAYHLLLTTNLFADEISELKQQMQVMKKQMEAMQKKIETLETGQKIISQAPAVAKRPLIKYTPGEGIEVEPAGLNISANGTLVFQGTPDANGDYAKEGVINGAVKADVDIEKTFDDWGYAFLELEMGDGQSLENRLTVFSNVDSNENDTNMDVIINKLYYDQYLFDKQFTVAFGKMDIKDYIDYVEYANSDSTQFMGRLFVHAPGVEWPTDNGGVVRFNVAPASVMNFIEFDAAACSADGDWDDIFDHLFYAAQINFKPAKFFNVDEEKWSGNYRFYWWMNDRNHSKLVSEGDTTDDNKLMNYGFGLSCDQKIGDVFGLFYRFGWQRPNVGRADGEALLEWNWQVGAQATGHYWNRDDDVLGIAVGQLFPSSKWKKSSSDNYGNAEGHIEAYYRCQLNKCLAISPDIQLIWNPDGISKSDQGDNDLIFVYGARAYIDF